MFESYLLKKRKDLFTNDCSKYDTCDSEAHLSAVKLLEEIIFVFNNKLELNAVGHYDYDQAQNGHHGFFGRISVGVQNHWWLLKQKNKTKNKLL